MRGGQAVTPIQPIAHARDENHTRTYLDTIVPEVQSAQQETLCDPANARYPVVAHVEGFQPWRQVSPVHRLHPAKKIVADVEVPERRHGRQDGDVQHLKTTGGAPVVTSR